MDTLKFFGSILPTVHNVSTIVPTRAFTDTGLVIKTMIGNSAIFIDCEMPEYKEEYFPNLYVLALDMARTAANITCFATGWGLTAILTSTEKPNGETLKLVTQDLSLAELCTAYKSVPKTPPEINNLIRVMYIVHDTPMLSLAMDDLMVAISSPHHTAINCGRAIDGIRRLITPNPGDDRGWPAMRAALNVDRPFLSYVMDLSKDQRHGHRPDLPNDQSRELIRRAWQVVNRYIELRKRDNHPLSAPDFPLLIG
jgi:hypothetical protein